MLRQSIASATVAIAAITTQADSPHGPIVRTTGTRWHAHSFHARPWSPCSLPRFVGAGASACLEGKRTKTPALIGI
jgi:hypothetical protein